jgi:hypothetical protein
MQAVSEQLGLNYVDISAFHYALTKLEDVATVLDREISISTASSKSSSGFKLSLELVNGTMAITLGIGNNIAYTPDDEEMSKQQIAFISPGTPSQSDHRQDFDRAFRQILKIDRLNGEEDPDQYEEN